MSNAPNNTDTHTPGPWWFSEAADGHWDVGAGDCVLACVHKKAVSWGYNVEGTDQANARLMMSAPELAESLAAVLEVWTAGMPCKPDSLVLKRAQAALSKAGVL